MAPPTVAAAVLALVVAVALWGGTAGLAMVCPISLSGKAAKRNYGNHESPYAVPPRTRAAASEGGVARCAAQRD
ncbi:hypothetical protein [Mobiluncus mulieris]|uniref:hypothetical protein n=1 Tax=Mobiluncus mulieris TaxID=2052 RepID=UPI000E1B6BA0|nr:hypothetical protein [Mobiluncus mulieris]